MYVLNKMDLWSYRFWKERRLRLAKKKQETSLRLTNEEWDHYNDLLV